MSRCSGTVGAVGDLEISSDSQEQRFVAVGLCCQDMKQFVLYHGDQAA